jgi:TM2 domain-containing membrane protein YozV
MTHPTAPSGDNFSWSRPTSSAGAVPPSVAGGSQMVPVNQYRGAIAPTQGVVPAKSPGIAALLSFLWLGAGHLYTGSVAAGVILLICDGLLFLLSLTGVGLIVTVPVWLIVTPIVMILAARSASNFNQRNGIIVR